MELDTISDASCVHKLITHALFTGSFSLLNFLSHAQRFRLLCLPVNFLELCHSCCEVAHALFACFSLLNFLSRAVRFAFTFSFSNKLDHRSLDVESNFKTISPRSRDNNNHISLCPCL